MRHFCLAVPVRIKEPSEKQLSPCEPHGVLGSFRDLEIPRFNSRSTDKPVCTQEVRLKARDHLQNLSRTVPSKDKMR